MVSLVKIPPTLVQEGVGGRGGPGREEKRRGLGKVHTVRDMKETPEGLLADPMCTSKGPSVHSKCGERRGARKNACVL